MPRFRDRRKAQAGTTLVEVMVSLAIASLALALIVGTLSNGLLDSAITKRNAAAQGVLQYEMGAINASTFSSSASSYSDCFATESPTAPQPAASFQAVCPPGQFTLRADVSWVWLNAQQVVQVWTVSIATADGSNIGRSVQVYKISR